MTQKLTPTDLLGYAQKIRGRTICFSSQEQKTYTSFDNMAFDVKFSDMKVYTDTNMVLLQQNGNVAGLTIRGVSGAKLKQNSFVDELYVECSFVGAPRKNVIRLLVV